MKSYEATGKTLEEARENGLRALGATITDVDVKVLVEGSKGLFGMFGAKAWKVLLTMKEEEADPLADLMESVKPVVAEAPKPVPVKAEAPKAEAKPAPVKPEAPKAEAKPAPVKPEAPKAEAKPAPVKREAPKAEPVPAFNAAPAAEKEQPKPVQRRAKPQGESDEDKPARTEKKRPPRAKSEKPEAEDKAKASAKERKPLPPKEITPVVKPVVTMIPDDQVDAESAAGKAQTFMKELTQLMGVNVEVAVGTDEDQNVFVRMTGDTLGILIGRRGETLDALQYLTSLKINKGQENYTRVTLDTENYRAKREDALVRLANRMANKAVKTGRKVTLEPMNPYERRIIHAALQPNEMVDTHSEGEEPKRHIVITLRK